MGRPKGELRIGGRPILEYLLERFVWQGPTLLVTAPGREHPPGWERFDREAVDPVADRGPLRGILTALEQMQTARVIVATVDMPGVERSQLDWLGQNFASDKMGLLLKHGDQIEPFPSIFRIDAAAIIEVQLAATSRSVKQLAGLEGFQSVVVPQSRGESVWVNLNRPSDLAKWKNEPQINTDDPR
jgi:molybdopterin-guanine dinucleotide biosynthesis protein A